MLVLSRQRDETIMIGDDVEITVVDIRGDKVRLGITAPTRIAVHRKEVYEAIKRENELASRVEGGDLSAMRSGVAPGSVRALTRQKASQLSSGQAPPGGAPGAIGPGFASRHPGEPSPRRAQGA